MKAKCALLTAGTVFGLAALIQLARLYFQFAVTIGTTPIPLWANLIAFIIFVSLSIWMFYSTWISSKS